MRLGVEFGVREVDADGNETVLPDIRCGDRIGWTLRLEPVDAAAADHQRSAKSGRERARRCCFRVERASGRGWLHTCGCGFG
jgi:hypothetical protein